MTYLRSFCRAGAAAVGFVLTMHGALAQEAGDAPAPRRDAALIEAWGRNVLTGPVPDETEEPEPPPPLPDSCRVARTGLEAGPGREAFFGRRLAADAIEAGEGWTELHASAPGRWEGDFDHAHLRVEGAMEQVCFVHLGGAEILVVNGEPYFGDPERRGGRGVPVQFRAGTNDLLVCGARDGFELEFWSAPTRIILGTWDTRIQDENAAVHGFSSGMEELDVPVFNASSSAADGLHFHYGHLVAEEPGRIAPLHEWRDGGRIPPLAFLVKSAFVLGLRDPFPADARTGVMALCAFDWPDRDADRQIARLVLDDPDQVRPAREAARGEQLLWGGLESVYLVYATGGTEPEDAQALAVARFLQQSLWYRSRRAVKVLADHDIGKVVAQAEASQAKRPVHFEGMIQHPQLVLIGDAKRSLAWPQLARIDDVRAFLPERIARDDDPPEGVTFVASSAMPGHADWPVQVALIHSRTPAGLRLAAALDLSMEERASELGITVVPAGPDLRVEPLR